MKKIRLGFCKNTGNEKGKEISGVLINHNYNDILTAAKNKLKIKSKIVRLFVARKFASVSGGLELNENNIDCLINDVVICVSLGENFSLAKDKEHCALSCPYIWNMNSDSESNDKFIFDKNTEQNNDTSLFCKLPQPYQKFEMNGDLPILNGNIVMYVKEITRENASIFSEKDFGEYSTYDYKSSTTPFFPHPKQFKNLKEKWIAGLKRECRGLIVCNKTGNVLARRFHKFFNINENEESVLENITFNKNCVLINKIDGSLVSPFRLNGKIIWASRNDIFENNNVISYNKFSEYCIDVLNSTPLFEWCDSSKIIGVVEHQNDSLTLLSIRNIITGDYMPYSEMVILANKFTIPCVEQIEINDNLPNIIKKITNISGIEGCVLHTENNNMYKIKTYWYTSLAQASKNGGKRNSSFLLELIKKRPIVKDIPIYRIYDACLEENFDDHIALCYNLLCKGNAKEEAEYLQKISAKFLNSIENLNLKIINWVENNEKNEKSAIILQAMVNAGWPNSLALLYTKNKYYARDLLVRKLKEKCSFKCLAELENLIFDENMIETSNSKYKLFCDLDCVLVDFEKGVFDLTNRNTAQFNKHGDMWKEIAKNNNFWTELEWTNDGKQLWNFINNNINYFECQILSGIPDGKMGKDAIIQKKIWCNKNLGENICVNTCDANKKHNFCKNKNILIDDRLQYKNKWEANGGIFIHHINSNQTINELKKLLNIDYYTVSQNCILLIDNNNNAINNSLLSNIIRNDNCKIVTINIEYKSDDILQLIYPECLSLPALIQLSFNNSDKIFLIDCLNMKNEIIENLMYICENEKILKLFYDIKNILSRFIALLHIHKKQITHITPVIDIYKILQQNFFQNDIFDIKLAAHKILDLEIDANKFIAMSDWGLRPLSLSQQIHAATLTHVLMRLYDKINSKTELLHQKVNIDDIIDKKDFAKYIFSSENNIVDVYNLTPIYKIAPQEEVNIEYIAIFLTTQSRNLILELFPPLHKNRIADHITLLHKTNINENVDINNFDIGKIKSFQIIGKCNDDKCQTLIVKILDDKNNNEKIYHLTISTATGINPSYSNELIEKEIDNTTKLTFITDNIFTGKIGLCISVNNKENLLSELSPEIKTSIIDLVNNNQTGNKIIFKSGILSANERSIIHDYAEYYNLISESEGPKENRQLTLTKPHKWTKPKFEENTNEKIIKINNDKHGKKQKITFKKHIEHVFRLIFDNDILINCKFKNFKTLYHGKYNLIDKIKFNESNINDNTKLLNEILNTDQNQDLIIIMRGLPGSGKSTLSNYIKNINKNTVICSADQYFEKIPFDEKKLQQAHDYCRDIFITALENKSKIIIVDNTNITLNRYSFYKRKSKEYSRKYIVIEMICNSEMSYSRNTHNVPLDKINKMHELWEEDFDNNVIRIISTD